MVENHFTYIDITSTGMWGHFTISVSLQVTQKEENGKKEKNSMRLGKRGEIWIENNRKNFFLEKEEVNWK